MRFVPFAALLFVVPALAAQKTPPVFVTRAAATHPAPDKPASLPVTRVSLYKNGVGYFEHTGHVSGDADVSIDFTTSQLNDVLQSLTAIDLNGGRISGAGYNSTTPLDQQLKALPLALGQDTTAADFYAAIRGARVEVHAAGADITGRLLSVEDRTTPAKDGDDSKGIERHFITVVSDAGEVRTLELTQSTSVRLLDTDLHQDVTRYLQLLAGNRSQGLRHLTLTDRGTGSRELHVSYISEVPIWKSTYRILFTDVDARSANSCDPAVLGIPKDGKIGSVSVTCHQLDSMPLHTATLQGWAVVDNTVGEDWTNVQLSLIAGAPQSFIQPLSDPIYSRRPEVPIAQEAQLTPQTFDSGLYESMGKSKQADKFSGGGLEQLGDGPMAASGATGSPVRISAGVAQGKQYDRLDTFAKVFSPPSYQLAAAASLDVNTKTAAFDDFFEYKISQPISIRKNESALVPILQSKIEADRVTLVSSNGYNTAQPLRALWIKNTSGLTLDRGSFALIENGNFGGEGLMDPIHADERRLLSYAADQAVHVSTEDNKTGSRITQLHGTHGVVNIHRSEVHEITYVIHNSAADRRTVVLEQPIQAGYKLDADTKPEETTATVYRFRVEAAPGETVRLHVGSTHSGYTTYYLARSDDDKLKLIVTASEHNAALEKLLQPVFDARRKVADAQTSVDQTNAKLTNLRGNEERQRANITALNAADKGSRDRFVHDLNATEDEIKAAQTELTTRTAALEAAKAGLATAIDNFSISEKP